MNVKAIKRNMKNEKGLTLIELLAVIVILGIIAAIAIPAIGNIIQKSKVDAVKSEAIQVLNAAKLYISSNGIPEGGTQTLRLKDANESIGEGDLSSFVDEYKYDSYYVVVSAGEDGKVTYKISSKKINIGKSSITFDGATIGGINRNKEYKDDVIIDE